MEKRVTHNRCKTDDFIEEHHIRASDKPLWKIVRKSRSLPKCQGRILVKIIPSRFCNVRNLVWKKLKMYIKKYAHVNLFPIKSRIGNEPRCFVCTCRYFLMRLFENRQFIDVYVYNFRLFVLNIVVLGWGKMSIFYRRCIFCSFFLCLLWGIVCSMGRFLELWNYQNLWNEFYIGSKYV